MVTKLQDKMTKEQVLVQLCMICERVMRLKYNSRIHADCFCGNNPGVEGDYRFDTEIIEFIKNAVDKELG